MRVPEKTMCPFDFGPLLRGDADVIAGWIAQITSRNTREQILVIALGAGAFGAAMGSWRAPEQAVWTAVKLPVVFFTTAAGNALINGMLAPLLGMDLRLRESFGAVLTSFTLAAVILGGFSPVMIFLVYNLPAPSPGVELSTMASSLMLLMLVVGIAFAGVVANVRLLQLLRKLGGKRAAGRTLWAWLAVNFLLGSQVSWICRPFVGRAGVPVAFLTEHPLESNFFEGVARAVRDLSAHFSP